jgi:diguanylate cyclase (GGDEF)-like protein/PAS domain S-box-containing protein
VGTPPAYRPTKQAAIRSELAGAPIPSLDAEVRAAGARLRILILEDHRSEALLLVRRIRQAGYQCDPTIVDTERGFMEALLERPDLVLTDYHVPGFGGPQALAAVLRSGHDIPVIVVSGEVGEEIVAQTITAGAADYLMKDRLSRLGSCISRVMEEREVRRLKVEAERQLTEWAEQAGMMIAKLSDAVLTLGADGAIQTANAAAERLFSVGEGGLDGSFVTQLLSRASGEPIPQLGWQTEPDVWRDGRGVRSDGGNFWAEWWVTPLRLGSDSKFLLIVRDISERKAHLDSLSWRATHDALTGLPNRTLFADRVTQAISEASRAGIGRALVMLDLDGFKAINDTYGHHAGDEVLRTVGERLSKVLRAADTVARLGGDEFGVLLVGDVSATGIQAIISKLSSKVAEPIAVGGDSVALILSVGVAMFPGDGTTYEALAASADRTMYTAKRGHHVVEVHSLVKALPKEPRVGD